jgi:hypothetical protein
MRTLIIFILYLSNSFNSFSAIIKWVDVSKKKAFRLDTQMKILEIEISPEKWQTIGQISLVDVQDYDLIPTIRFESLPTNKANQSYILADCTNQVYIFDFEKMQLQRIDKTFFRGYNCLSTRFLRNGIIYCFGGYGMFRTNNLMTYFQPETKEWMALNPANEAPRSIDSGLEGYSKEKDVFFSGLNHFYSDSENKAKPIYDFGFYAYDFKTKLWGKLGVIEQEALEYFCRDGVNKNVFWNGKYFIAHYFQSPFSRVIIIDPIKNEVYQWDDKAKILGVSIYTFENEFAKEYVLGDSLYCIQELRIQKDVFVKNILSIEQMKKNAKPLGKLYVSEINKSSYYMLSALGLIVLIGFIFLKQKKIQHNQKVVSLNTIEKRVLTELIINKREEGLSAEQLNELIEIDKKSLENQRKLRSDFLKTFEAKLSQIYQVSNPIERIPSNTDKRMMAYKLNEAILKRA